jgi:hypothetical protein
MNNKRDIDINVEAAMNSLDGMQSATPGAFFFTRVQARLSRKEKSIWEKVSSFMARPVVAITVILAVIITNAAVIIQQKDNTPSLVEQSEQSVYDDFNLAANTFYDYETSEP